MNSESSRFRRGALPAGSFATIAALSLCAMHSSRADLVHRWSFDNAAGSADGATVTDSVGGAGFDAYVLGNGATFTGTALRLPGGASGTAPYIDLPNDLIGANSPITSGASATNMVSLECWVTVKGAAGGWARFLDFGTNNVGEIAGPGQGFGGTNYLLYTAATGDNYNTQQLELKIDGGGTVWRPDRPVAVDQELYFIITIDSSGGGSIVNLWRNGEHVPLSGATLEGSSGVTLSQIIDVNNWLGRSNYSSDANLNAEFNEFRIYDHVLSEEEIFASRASGAATLVVDVDNDGMPDGWETANNLVVGTNDAAGNPDGDGLTNVQEFQRGTNPHLKDTDNDGLNDEMENNSRIWDSATNTGTDPLDPDTDRDGLKDGVETKTGTFASATSTGTDPHVRDTDGDMAGDGTEVASGSDPTKSESLPQPKLDHRYSFSETSGWKVTDSVGGANGAINGYGTTWEGGKLTLAGGNPNQAAYVALPAGLVSNYGLAKGGRGAVTVEGWATVLDTSGGNWARIFDFGSSQPGGANGAVFGVGNWNGGATEGMDTFWLSGYNGIDAANRTFSIRKADGGVGTSTEFGVPAAALIGEPVHFVATFDESSGRLRYFENGNLVNSLETSVVSPITLGVLRDVNNWLGRSNFTNDGILHAQYDEIRIYDGALMEEAVTQHFADGPDANPGTAGAADSDGDGILDWYERAHGLNPASNADAALDPDGDGVTNLQEYQRGSSPQVKDTDGDGLSDAVETNTGVFVSASSTGTNPAAYDTDGDFASDNAEVASGTSPVDPAVFPAALLHRWSFNNPAGNVPAETPVTDAVNNQQNAVVHGSGAKFTGTGISLPGGASSSAAYVDLPNNIISPLKNVTVETWVSLQSSTANWSRIFDFGNTLDGNGDGIEITDVGGGGGGGDYFFLSPSTGTNFEVNRVELHKGAPTSEGNAGSLILDNGVANLQNEVLHFVAMVESSTTGSSRVTLWRNGVPLNTNIPAGMNLSDIQDLNAWIGRSNYLADSNLQGTVEEFRIYNGLLSPAQIAKNLADGPDAAITPTPPTVTDFQITVVAAAPGQQLTVTFPTKTGKTYQVETSTSMTATTWSNVGAAVAGTGSPVTVTDTVNGVQGRRFYRVRES